ncbi:hypothetical protein CQW23_24688 [Capsicum baccatum]|uniref:Uncharacterized protein n=1 Tax=Capsicum baccatum TaxID=33114 RepID=A0A2G2VVI1_CAPBA|nr:hypothetical protein CQW23_24688 [Capsicum baccatum]
MMNSLMKHASTIFNRPNWEVQLQQWRGIRVKVRNNNLDQALFLMQKKMQSSGMERLIKREQLHHIKNSEKRVLARKILERKIRSQELARKLKSILIKKVSFYGIIEDLRNSQEGKEMNLDKGSVEVEN